jgi:sec-independent protein translocase protein TatB
MPQIGWLEILAVVIVAILVLGPKEFPVAIKKIGSYVGKFKNFISNMQNEISSVGEDVDLDIKEVEEKDTEKKNIIKAKKNEK